MSIVKNKLALMCIEKQAGIKRTERILTSLMKKTVGGKKALKHILDTSGPFADPYLAPEAAKLPYVAKNNKGLMNAIARSADKLERRISRFGGGEDKYFDKLFTQFRGYGHIDTLGRRLTRAI